VVVHKKSIYCNIVYYHIRVFFIYKNNIYRIVNYLKKYENWVQAEKVIFNIFLCYHESYPENIEKWNDYIQKFKKLDVDWWVKPQPGHHSGLAYQSILNTSDIDEAKEISEKILDVFSDDALIVLSKGEVRNFEPVGQNFDKAFWGCGRYFDKLVREKKKGIYIYGN